MIFVGFIVDQMEVRPDGSCVCLVCGKLLAHRESAKRHYQIKHSDNTTKYCKICKKSFKNVHSRDTHTRSQHDVNPNELRDIPSPTP